METKQSQTSPAEARENIMGTMEINPLLVKLSVPMMISMLVQALYNVVDSVFVSHVSESALTAVSLAFPIQLLMIAVATGLGVGINSLISRKLGQKRAEEAREAAQELVPGGVPHPVVDLLEVVEVDQEEGRGEAALGPGDEPGEVLVHDAAIRKVGEGVVPREVDDRILVAFPLGHVQLDRDEVGDLPLFVPHGGDRQVLDVGRAVLAAVRHLALPGPAGEDRLPELLEVRPGVEA